MKAWKDYYQILGVDYKATAKQIKDAYHYKSQTIHPDKVPEKYKQQANDELKWINIAYETLKDPEKKRRYDSDWRQKQTQSSTSHSPKPKPIVTPSRIQFKNVASGVVQTGSFILENNGGPYHGGIKYTNPDSWLDVVGLHSLNPTSQLPVQFEIEAVGEEWGTDYAEYINIRLDDQQVQVKVELTTQTEPSSSASHTYTTPSSKTNVTQSVFSRVVNVLLGVIGGLLVGGAIVYAIIFHTGQFGPTIGRILVGIGATGIVWCVLAFLFKDEELVWTVAALGMAIVAGVLSARSVGEFNANLVAFGVFTVCSGVSGGFVGYKVAESNVFPQISVPRIGRGLLQGGSIWSKKVLIPVSIVLLVLLGFGLKQVFSPSSKPYGNKQQVVVSDSGQNNSALDVNGLPTITIASPRNRSTFVEGERIAFKGEATDPEDGQLPAASLLWSSSINGRIGAGRSVITDDLAVGPHTITLTGTDSQGTTEENTIYLLVTRAHNESPKVAMEVSPTSGRAPLEVNFDASVSSDPDGSITAYSWDFGDETIGSGITTSHTYSLAGDYVSILMITDDNGAQDSMARVITVEEPIPEAQPGKVLFSDDFANDLDQRWRTTPAWRVTRGRLYRGYTGKGQGYAYIPHGVLWDDYLIEVDVDCSSETAGILFRCQQGLQNYVLFWGNRDKLGFQVVVNSEVVTESKIVSPGFFEGTQAVKIMVYGSTYKAFLDGALRLEFKDSTFLQGMPGLASFGAHVGFSGSADYDNFRVRTLD